MSWSRSSLVAAFLVERALQCHHLLTVKSACRACFQRSIVPAEEAVLSNELKNAFNQE